MKFQESEFAQRIEPSKTLAVTALVAEMRSKGKTIIDLGAGEPDFFTPDYIRAAGIQAIKDGKTKYTPNTGTLALREAICQYLKKEFGVSYDAKQVVLSNGAKQCVLNTILAVCNPGDEVIIPAPYWVSYPEQAKMAGAIPVFIESREKNGFKVTADELERAITPRTKMILLNNPSNPTGAVFTKEELSSLAEVISKKEVFLLSDEIYIELTYSDTSTTSMATFEQLLDRLFLVNGFSKAYAMTGWRLGYVVAPIDAVKSIAKIQSHSTSGPCSISQEAGIAALKEKNDVLEMKKVFEQRRDFVHEQLNRMPGVSAPKPGGAFYMFANIEGLLNREYAGKKIASPTDLAQVLVEHAGVALVGGEGFGSDKHVRISYSNSMENLSEAMKRLSDLFVEIHG